MQRDMNKYMEMLRAQEDAPDVYLAIRQPRVAHRSPDAAPLSPRQVARDDPRRLGQLNMPQHSFLRPPPPPPPQPQPPQPPPPPPPPPHHSSVSPRRCGSVGNGRYSPGSLRSHGPPPPPPPPYSLSSMHSSAASAAGLGRRHTSADIRLHGWQGPAGSPFASGQSSVQWPSSPKRTSNAGDHSQHVRDVLARYEMPQHPPPYGSSRQITPPLTNDTTPSTTSADGAWSFAGSRTVSKCTEATTVGSFSRRSSMASNVHSLLNPPDAAIDRGGGGMVVGEEDDLVNHDRKRKRLQ